MVEIKIHAGTTHKAEEQFAKYQQAFGEIVEAEMFANKSKVDYELMLTNRTGDKMHIYTGLTSGYSGTGPHGTCRVLAKAGFKIDEEFVHAHETFKLKK